MNSKYLIVVTGPTASGKTGLAIALARHFGCEILSCDSRQFFREMSIGTAAPTPEELVAAPHHFIHHKSIFDEYSVGDFEKDALQLLEELYKKQDLAILVGGSGLYVNAVLKGFDTFPPIDRFVRESVSEAYDANGLSWLQERLQQLDPIYYEQVDRSNPQRMMRALEVSIGTGKPYSSYLAGQTAKRPFTSIVIGLNAERELLYDRINRRVDLMMEQGLEDEARALYQHRELNALQTVGYRELFEHFDGFTGLEHAVEEIKKNTRRFAKRQLTWFRRDESTTWFDIADPVDKVIRHIESKILP
jgi:tRNA dimethylallyltransferase